MHAARRPRACIDSDERPLLSIRSEEGEVESFVVRTTAGHEVIAGGSWSGSGPSTTWPQPNR